MKKIITLPLIAAIALSVAACSKKADEAPADNAAASTDLNSAASDAIADVNASAADATANAGDAIANAAEAAPADNAAANGM